MIEVERAARAGYNRRMRRALVVTTSLALLFAALPQLAAPKAAQSPAAKKKPVAAQPLTLNAALQAAGRGVQVQLLLADWSKRPHTIAGLQKLARIPNIAVRLTTIPLWSGGFIPFARVTHAKALVVDGKRVAAGSFDGMVRVYDGGSGRLLATLLSLPPAGEQKARLEADLAKAQADYDRDPSSDLST